MKSDANRIQSVSESIFVSYVQTIVKLENIFQVFRGLLKKNNFTKEAFFFLKKITSFDLENLSCKQNKYLYMFFQSCLI